MGKEIFILYALFLVCHFLADFTFLSTPWMLAAKKEGKPFYPILVHAAVHAILMGVVSYIFVDYSVALRLAGIQLITHFFIDVWKGRMNVWFPLLLDNSKKEYWIIFGFDQLLHQLVILFMVYFILYLS